MNNPIPQSQFSRAVRREEKTINDFLDKLVLSFLLHCQEMKETDFAPISETQKIINFKNGILPGETRGEQIAKKFCTLNYQWRKFCNKKWLYHKLNLDGFEKGVEKNIKQLRSMPKENPSLKLEIVKR